MTQINLCVKSPAVYAAPVAEVGSAVTKRGCTDGQCKNAVVVGTLLLPFVLALYAHFVLATNLQQ